MPSLANLFGKAPEGPLKIPVAPVVALGHAVYYVPGYPPLSAVELRQKLPAWLDAHMAEPLRGAVKQFAASDQLAYTDDLQRSAIPLPPYDLLRSEGAGDEDLRRLEKGYQLVMVSCRDPNNVPRLGLWTALAGAMAAAQALNGAAYDPARMAVLPLGTEPPIPGDGVVRVREHITIRSGGEGGAGGAGWASTHGMSKFGAPEFRVGFAAGIQPPLAMLEEAAQALVDAVLRANNGREACVDAVEFGPRIIAAGLPLTVRHRPGESGRGGWIDLAAAPPPQ